MFTSLKNYILIAGVHAFKIPLVMNQLEAYWICEELAMHKRYSPFLFQVELQKDLVQNFKGLLALGFGFMACAIILCAVGHLVLQCMGAMLFLLSMMMIYNLLVSRLSTEIGNVTQCPKLRA